MRKHKQETQIRFEGREYVLPCSAHKAADSNNVFFFYTQCCVTMTTECEEVTSIVTKIIKIMT